jgi:hypothetical protein
MKLVFNKTYFFAFAILLFLFSCKTDIRKGDIIKLNYQNDETPTYYQIIEKYKQLANSSENAKLIEYGLSDAGKPLHLFVISGDSDFNPKSLHKNGKTIVMINNGIHPGEPCGIDASLQFANDILINKNNLKVNLENTVICIIPVYNIGGALNRSAYNRTGQIGPKECGFRGNAKNLDLNRDFVKCDTENAKSFTKIFQLWEPEIFLDTHTTNGSNHQYTITLIPPQPNSIPRKQESFLREEMLPALYKKMDSTDYSLIPYVVPFNRSPENGIMSYVQTGKFSSGYAQLFNCLGFMTENHVYKSYFDRVRSVYSFIASLVKYGNTNSNKINSIKKNVDNSIKEQKEFILKYKLDTSKFSFINFKGFEAGNFESPLTGVKRFGYDENKPWEKKIKYYDYYIPKVVVEKPEYYIIPQAWSEVISRIKINNIEMKRLIKDTILTVEVYYITNYNDNKRKNNGHRVHNNVETSREMQQIAYYKGDYVIRTNQKSNRYIVEMLEPKGAESFFAWNFFDSCLETREYFSSYGFEKNAMNYLESHPDFKAKFNKKRKEDVEFASNHREQLAYIYHNTEWDELSYNRYPVTRINEKCNLPIQ